MRQRPSDASVTPGDDGSVTPGGFRLRDVAVSAFAPTVVNAVGHAAVLPVLALLARELGASVGQAALVVALLGVGSLAGALPAGALVARVGERRAIALAGLLEAVAMVVAATAGSLAVLGLAVVTSGLAWAVFLLARQGFLIMVSPVAMRARAMSTLGGSHRIGGFVGPVVGAALLAWSGELRSVFWLASAMAVLATVVVLLAPRLPGEDDPQPWSRRGRRADVVPGPDAGAAVVTSAGTSAGTSADTPAGTTAGVSAGAAPSVLSVLREHRRTLVAVGSAVLLISGTRALRATLLPLWAEEVGIGAATTSLVFGAAALLEIALFYPAGWLMDRRGRTLVAVPVVALIGLGVLLLPLAQEVVAFTALALLMAVGNGLGSGIVMTLGADTSPAVGRSQYLGGFRLAGDLGGLGGPLLVSALALAVPLTTVCVVMGGICLLGSGWVWRQVARVERHRLG